ncbi:MAG: hypothetical protein IPP01_10385 [Saprospiraceae bacterium]|nr:hypothetical protein [Saprospiraceae bacterium]
MEIITLAKSNELLSPYKDSKLIKTLSWFSEYYYNAIPMQGDTIQYNDLRYGTMSFKFDRPEDFIFHFNLVKENNELRLLPEERPKNDRRDLALFWKRLKGN